MIKTTDPQDEIFDIVNDRDDVIGQATRGECHQKNLKHRSVSVIAINSNNQIFLQKRSQTKDTLPGYWTLSATGHVDSGKDYQTTAVREVEEELGIKISPNDITSLDKIYVDSVKEFNSSFVFRHSGPFTLHPQEIESGQWMNLEKIIQQYHLGKLKLTPVTINNLTNKNIYKKLIEYIDHE